MTDTKELLSKIASAVENLTSGDDWKSYLGMQSKLRKYSFNNVLLILTQKPDASAVASYKKWEELGRQVRKGEKAIKILAPSTYKKEVEKKDGSKEEQSGLYFRAVPVFDISQTDGPDMPKLTSLLTGDDDGVFDLLLPYATVLGYTVSVCAMPDARNGDVHFEKKTIRISNTIDTKQRAKTLAHELGHVILHSGEMDYDKVHERSHMEVEAESFAFCIMDAFGIDSSNYTFGYVAGWSGGDVKKIRESATRIQKAVAQCLGHFDDALEIRRLRAENAKLKAA
jgi:antirestriction protein ArdC